MEIFAQIKEYRDDITYLEKVIAGLEEDIQKIKDRQASGKIYGTETAELLAKQTMINNTLETIGSKQAKIQLLEEATKQSLF